MPNIKLAKRTEVPGSAIRKIFQTISTINAERKASNLQPIYDLSIGQPHLEPNNYVVDGLVEDLKTKKISFGYSPSVGRPETLDAIVKLYNHYYRSVSFARNEVMVTVGASEALMNAFSILLNPGDVALTFQPYFSTYKGQIATTGASLAVIPTLQTNFRPNIPALEKELQSNPKVKMVILNYPNNPSGVSLTKQEAVDLAKVLEKFPHVAIIIDDVYRDLNYQEHITVIDVAPQLKDRCIIIHSGAKGLAGAPGLRIGMASANPEWIQAMAQQELFAIANVPDMTQRALVHAVDDFSQDKDQKFLTKIRKEYQNNLTLMQAELEKYNLKPLTKPGGAFYLFVSAKHLIGLEVPKKDDLHKKMETTIIRNDEDIVNYFIHAANTATVPGSGFEVDPKEGFIRISCAKPAEILLKAANAIGESIKLLSKPEIVKKPVTADFNWTKTAVYASFGVASAAVIYGLFAKSTVSKQAGSVSANIKPMNTI